MKNDFCDSQITRREALKFLGMAAATVVAPGAASAASAPEFPKHAIIRTILKDMSPQELAGGPTLFHEHMSFAADFMPRWIAFSRRQTAAGGGQTAAGGGQTAAGGGQSGRGAGPEGTAPPSNQPYFMQDINLMVDEIKAAKSDGIACIVDAGHEDMGRSLDFLKELSERSGMPIVAGTGFYSQPFYPPQVATWSEDQIAQDTIHRASTQPVGALGEIGSWDEITDEERKVFRAVAKAHLATNLPIFTHTGIPGKSAMEQLDILENGGVKPQHIVIGHLGNLVDPDVKVQSAICKRGAFIGFDRQGGPGDAQQVPMVVKLIEEGYADNLMFSSDFSSANQLKQNGGPGYAKTVTVFVPKLRQAGVKEDVLHGILVDNPRRFLAFVPKTSRKSLGV
jgi:phosphotriesterase-related protein